jgi:hypothetical protein
MRAMKTRNERSKARADGTKLFTVPMDEETKAALRRVAAADRRTMSDWLRLRILEEDERLERERLRSQ